MQTPFATQLPTLGATLGVGAQTGPTSPHVPITPVFPGQGSTTPGMHAGGYIGPPGVSPGPSGTYPGPGVTGIPFGGGVQENPAKPTGNTGAVWSNTFQQGLSREARLPRTFPGIESSGNSWAKYQDGSFVDYNSLAWKKAQGYNPDPKFASLWQALPDSWKADIGSWDKTYTDNYLTALAAGSNGVMYNGQYMSGNQAAAAIRDAAYKQRTAEHKAGIAEQKQQAASNARFPSSGGATFTPSPFV